MIRGRAAARVVAVVVAVMSMSLLTGLPADGATPSERDVIENTAQVRIEQDGNALIITAKPSIYGAPLRLMHSTNGVDRVPLLAFTPTAARPKARLAKANLTLSHYLYSDLLPRPIGFRPTRPQSASAAKADTLPSAPTAKLAVKTTRVKPPPGAFFQMSPRGFPTFGQTLRLDEPIALDKVGMWLFVQSTLLTKRGIEIVDGPGPIDWSSPELVSAEIFNDDRNYVLTCDVTVTIYGGVTDPLAEVIDPSSLVQVAQSRQRLRMKLGEFIMMPFDGERMAPGNYLVTVTMDNVPKNVLTIMWMGSNFRPGRPDQYPQGQVYRIDDEYQPTGDMPPITVFLPHTSKRLPVSESNRNAFDRGDITVLLYKR